MKRVATSLLVVQLASCAIIDGLGGSDDDNNNNRPPGTCGQTTSLGFVAPGDDFGPVNSCAIGQPLDLSESCGDDLVPTLGMVFELDLPPEDLDICVSSPRPSNFTIDLVCLENGGGACVFAPADSRTCINLDLEGAPGTTTAFVHWQPNTMCGEVAIDVELF